MPTRRDPEPRPEQRPRRWSAPALLKLVAAPLTAGRMTLVWRLFGAVLVLLWLQHMDDDSLFEFADESTAALDALGLVGLALLIVGPSLVVLAASTGAGLWFLVAVLRESPGLEFMADEYIVQAGVPIVATIVALAVLIPAIRRDGPALDLRLRERIDDVHARVFRIFLITTLAFAGIHKLNADFFAAGSCANLGRRLREWWELPIEPPVAGPVEIVTLELLAVVMLLAYPRLGILLVVYTMAGLGHIGPAAFASTCMIMSLAFLDRGDAAVVRRSFARTWGVLTAAGLVVIATSYSSYVAPLPWFKYGLLEACIVVVTWIAIATGVARLRQRRSLRRRLTPAAIRWWRQPPTVLPGLASWLALVLVVNGMTPYLGIKYRFSVAMLSNLRVDQERWNSYVVPRWISLREQTPHVVVDWEPIGRWASKGKPGQIYLSDGLFSPEALSVALQDASTRRAQGYLRVTYLDESAEFELPRDTLAAGTWVKRWRSSVLWQDRLGPGDEPQGCVH